MDRLDEGGTNPYEAPRTETAAEPEFTGYGDRNCEYVVMKRGKYPATLYVGGAFLLTAAVVWIPCLSIAKIEWAHRHALSPQAMPDWLLFATGLPGGALAWLVYRDRWLCIDAFASRFTTSVVNISLITALPAAFGYGLYRGALKLVGR